jgi:Calcineurin-like phosphoesterase
MPPSAILAAALLLALLEGEARAAVPELAVIADAGSWNENTLALRESIRRAGITGLVLPGDNLYGFFSSYDSAWGPWREAGLTFELVAIGNHNGGYWRERSYFGMPAEYYSRSWDGVLRLVSLNSDNEGTAGEQAAWLERELLAATEPAVFVVFHHPSRTLSEDHPWTRKKAFHDAVLPVLRARRDRITGVLAGHDHEAALVQLDDLPLVISGATKGPQTGAVPVHRIEDGVRVDTQWLFDGEATWARLTVSPSGTDATIRFTRARDDRVTCTVALHAGQPARPGANCSPWPTATRNAP